MSDAASLPPLSPAAAQLLDRFAAQKGERPGVHDWLILVFERYGKMAESMVRGLEAQPAATSSRQAVATAGGGEPLATEEVRRAAQELAAGAGKGQAAERDIVAVVLQRAGYEVTKGPPSSLRPSNSRGAAPSAVPVGPSASSVPNPGAAGHSSSALSPPASSRTMRPTPMLDRYGRDLTAAARDGRLSTVVGRQEELEAMILTLCRTTKPNPLLVGPAGTGKTAIVEALAHRIVRGEVPAALSGVRLVSLQPSSLLAGAGIVGELDKRMEAIVAEASQDGIVLFIDEVHAIMGAGGREGTGDMASMLKPALARGDISCVAATTDDEYRRFIENDKALERRFQAIRVNELTPAQTYGVLTGIRGELAERRGVSVGDDVLRLLVDTAAQRVPNRRFPDKAVDLLDHVVAHAISTGMSAVTVAGASDVIERLLGVPALTTASFEALRKGLRDDGLLPDNASRALIERLTITTRGLDLRTARPNATVLLTGDAGRHADAVARYIASTLFGAEDRVVRVNFARFTDHTGLHALLGSPPSYVGYADRHALDAVGEMPWSVVLCERVDLAHPAVRAAFAPALSTGVLTDYRGRRIYFSDAVVVMTAEGEPTSDAPRVTGFHASAEGGTRRPADTPDLAVALFGDDVAAGLDIVVSEPASPDRRDGESNVYARVLGAVADRFREQGVRVDWDPSVAEWLASSYDKGPEVRTVERLVEREVLPSLVYLAAGAGDGARAGDHVRVSREGGRLVVITAAPEEQGETSV